MKTLLITGVAGFIGAKIAQRSLLSGYKVFGVDDLSRGRIENVPEGVEFVRGDLAQIHTYRNLPKNIDYILHLAGQSSGEISFDDPVADLNKNAISTLNLIQYGIENCVKKIIYASSMSVYGEVEDKPTHEEYPCKPMSCYGVGKLAAENYLKIYQEQLPFVAFRMFNVYGPGQDMSNLRQGMVSIYLACALKNGHIPVKGSLSRFRDFIYIDDVVGLWLQAIENDDVNNQIFNLGTGVKTTVQELLQKIQHHIPHVTWNEIGSTRGDQFGVYADTSKLKCYFSQKSFKDLDDTLDSFIEWAVRILPKQGKDL